MKKELIGITRILAIAGCSDFSFCDDEAKWRGSEVHRIVELANRGTLDRRSIPGDLEGYTAARDKFMRETGFIVDRKKVECKVESTSWGIRGRVDAAGLLKGKHTVVDYKTGTTLPPSVGLQLCLGGFLLQANKHWQRCAVRLHKNGEYSLKIWNWQTWAADLATALAAARLAHWKIRNGLV